MQLNQIQKDPHSIKDISSNASCDPHVFIKNLNDTFESDKINWRYDNQENRVIVNTNDNAYVL